MTSTCFGKRLLGHTLLLSTGTVSSAEPCSLHTVGPVSDHSWAALPPGCLQTVFALIQYKCFNRTGSVCVIAAAPRCTPFNKMTWGFNFICLTVFHTSTGIYGYTTGKGRKLAHIHYYGKCRQVLKLQKNVLTALVQSSKQNTGKGAKEQSQSRKITQNKAQRTKKTVPRASPKRHAFCK